MLSARMFGAEWRDEDRFQVRSGLNQLDEFFLKLQISRQQATIVHFIQHVGSFLMCFHFALAMSQVSSQLILRLSRAVMFAIITMKVAILKNNEAKQFISFAISIMFACFEL